MLLLIEKRLRLIGACISVMVIVSTVISPLSALADTAIPTTETSPLTESTTTPTSETTTPTLQTSTQSAPIVPEPPTTTLTSSAVIDTTATQQAQSGAATLENIDNAGNTTTGNADSELALLNQANNITSLGGTVTILETSPSSTQNYVVSPQQINQPSTITSLPPGDIAIENNAAITNDIAVNSNTGGISAISNDTLGDATTGNATSSVAILNLANNIVATGDVFVGTITINEDYEKNIILSEALLDHLINGSGASSTVLNGDLSVESLQVVTNTVDTAATSGSVDASNNDTVGAINTGNAATNVDISTVSGSHTIFGNALLIIVTTTGQWNGNILNSPGTYIALISLDANGNPALLTPLNGSSSELHNLIVTNTSTVTNSVSATATTGNVVASKNDDIGNIATGNADVSVVIRNVLTNVVSISDWFGVLFINIFGDWNGSVVMQESLITPTPAPVVENSSGPPPAVNSYSQSTSQHSTETYIAEIIGASSSPQTIVAAAILDPVITKSVESFTDSSLLWILIVTIIGSGLFAGQRIFTIRQASL